MMYEKGIEKSFLPYKNVGDGFQMELSNFYHIY